MPRRLRSGGTALMLASSLIAAGCSSPRRVASATLTSFMRAVQEEDFDRLFCMLSGAATSEELGPDAVARRRGFENWAAERYAAYYAGREIGWVTVDDDPIALVKLLTLGKGTFFQYGIARRIEGGALSVETALRLGYAHVDLSRLTPGTTFYVAGVPIGRVHAVTIPRGPAEISAELLETVTLRWRLLRAEPAADCPGGWTIHEVAAVEGSATSREVTWVF